MAIFIYIPAKNMQASLFSTFHQNFPFENFHLNRWWQVMSHGDLNLYFPNNWPFEAFFIYCAHYPCLMINVSVETTALILERIRDSLVWSHFEWHGLGTQRDATLKFHGPMWKQVHGVSLFYGTKRVIITVSLKYIGRWIRNVVIARWEKLFYKLKMLADHILSFGAGIELAVC